MFGIIRLKKRAAALLSLIAAALIIGLCLLLLRAGSPDTVEINGSAYSLMAEDEKDVEAFLAACGFEPEGCVSDRMITVPKTWNSVYTAYQDLQKAQGMNLVPYKGREARELVYASADGGYAAVLVSGGRIIAAHRTTMLYGDEPRVLIE